MKTFKVQTPTTINYCLVVGGNIFAVRKNNKGFWKSVSYQSNLICTDNYILTVLDGYETKKDAINALVSRVNDAPAGFFHVQ